MKCLKSDDTLHILYRKAYPADFDGILSLQHQNLLTTLQGENLSQGFLSMEFTREQLQKINDKLGIFVAIQGETVIGYLMAETAEFAVGSPLIAYMLKRLKDVAFDGVPLSSSGLFVYGPVCIDIRYRGQGILEGLFCVMEEALDAGCDIGIAFISQLNARSFHAHTVKLGMTVIDDFEFNGRWYHALAFRVN